LGWQLGCLLGMFVGFFVGMVDVFDVFDGDFWCDSETSSEWQLERLIGFMFGVFEMLNGICDVILTRACDWTELNEFRMTIGAVDMLDGDSWCDSDSSLRLNGVKRVQNDNWDVCWDGWDYSWCSLGLIYLMWFWLELATERS